MMRGILSTAGYVPHWRLDRGEIASFFGTGGGRGTRAVASYDQDTTTLGVEAARLALRGAGEIAPGALWFATASPAYLDKTNATAIHAALRLDADMPALDFGGAIRSGVGALGAALRSDGSVLVVAADQRDGRPTSADEAGAGDGAAAVLVGSDDDGPLLAELLAVHSVTEELIDRWRIPGSGISGQWEERFGEQVYVPLVERAWKAALETAGLASEEVGTVVVTGGHARAVRSARAKLGVAREAFGDDLTATVGWTGAAHPALVLAAALEGAAAGDVVALVAIGDGVDVIVLRATDALAAWAPPRPVAGQVTACAPLPYGKFLSWRGSVTLEPPRRPEPGRISASIASRRDDWKYGFVGSRDESSGALHLPPARVSREGGALDEMSPAPMSDVEGTIAAFTVDRIAYSQSPPIVFAVVDFDGGGRLPIELTDVLADGVRMGDRVEMTFRRLFSAEGIHNYFWKARPIRAAASEGPATRSGAVAGGRDGGTEPAPNEGS